MFDVVILLVECVLDRLRLDHRNHYVQLGGPHPSPVQPGVQGTHLLSHLPVLGTNFIQPVSDNDKRTDWILVRTDYACKSISFAFNHDDGEGGWCDAKFG